MIATPMWAHEFRRSGHKKTRSAFAKSGRTALAGFLTRPQAEDQIGAMDKLLARRFPVNHCVFGLMHHGKGLFTLST
jgi:hypothetical protein